MARSNFSPSPSPGFASSRFSDSSLDDEPGPPDPSSALPSASRAGSPAQSDGQPTQNVQQDTIACQWEECGKVFSHLPTLIDHIHNDHIGVHKSNYTCEWKTCPRRGIAQTSRFALISHIRSHTGEKPFICPKPECDKSFTRSDALAKHMRIQHNIMPPLPGRGGNRKKRRDEPDLSHQSASDGYSTFKVDQQLPYDGLTAEHDEDRISPMESNGRVDYYHNSLASRRSPTPEVVMDETDSDDEIPSHLAALKDPETGLIMGRRPAMVKYLLLKAKHRYVLEEHSSLIEELRTLRYEEKCWRERKDALLDEVLRVTFGSHAVEELTMPPMMLAQEAVTGARPRRREADQAEAGQS